MKCSVTHVGVRIRWFHYVLPHKQFCTMPNPGKWTIIWKMNAFHCTLPATADLLSPCPLVNIQIPFASNVHCFTNMPRSSVSIWLRTLHIPCPAWSSIQRRLQMTEEWKDCTWVGGVPIPIWHIWMLALLPSYTSAVHTSQCKSSQLGGPIQPIRDANSRIQSMAAWHSFIHNHTIQRGGKNPRLKIARRNFSTALSLKSWHVCGCSVYCAMWAQMPSNWAHPTDTSHHNEEWPEFQNQESIPWQVVDLKNHNKHQTSVLDHVFWCTSTLHVRVHKGWIHHPTS